MIQTTKSFLLNIVDNSFDLKQANGDILGKIRNMVHWWFRRSLGASAEAGKGRFGRTLHLDLATGGSSTGGSRTGGLIFPTSKCP